MLELNLLFRYILNPYYTIFWYFKHTRGCPYSWNTLFNAL